MKVVVDKNTFMKLDEKVLLVLSAENDIIVKIHNDLATLTYNICQNGKWDDQSDPNIAFALNSLKAHNFISFDTSLPHAATQSEDVVVTQLDEYLAQDSFVPLHGQISSTACNCVCYCDNCGCL